MFHAFCGYHDSVPELVIGISAGSPGSAEPSPVRHALADLQPHNRDSVIVTVSHWVVE